MEVNIIKKNKDGTTKEKFEEVKKLKEKSNNDGMSLFTIVFLIFLTLKLGQWGLVADWNWWFVFLPILVRVPGALFSAYFTTKSH